MRWKDVWEWGFFVIVLTLAVTLVMGTGYIMGHKKVHAKWRQDAIERCSKTHGPEWCEGRAVLEKW